MKNREFSVGGVVEHPKRPEWGPGRILSRVGDTVKIFFRDDAEQDFRTIRLDRIALSLSQTTCDPILDNLPPFVDEAFDVKSARVTFDDGVRFFERTFPGGFDDPAYHERERAYKWEAHERYTALLGNGQAEALQADDAWTELCTRLCNVASHKINLLSPYESMALKDGLGGGSAQARSFVRALLRLVAEAPSQTFFEPTASCLLDVPLEEGKSRIATWPVLTIVPFLADPERFMFLKPEPTKECAERMRFEIQYSPELRWITYQKVMTLAETLLERLRPLGARDFMDAQSFMWVVAKYR